MNQFFKQIDFIQIPKKSINTDKRWVNICSLVKFDSHSDYMNCDTYLTIKNDIPEFLFQTYQQSFIEGIDNITRVKDNHIYLEKLFIAKISENQYIYRTCFIGHSRMNTYEEFARKDEKSDAVFIYVEYKHPKMARPIEFKFPNEKIFFVGNEIFTPAFVLNQLEHQYEKYVFDLDYSINILDHNMETIELKSTDYILLNKEDYKIVPFFVTK